jgi:enterochelin esterase-like enzyme
MHSTNVSGILVENNTIDSEWLQREVKLDFYLPRNVSDPSRLDLLLINDGQNMEELGLEPMLEQLYATQAIDPLVAVAIHAGEERKMEYGVAGHPDYQGRGVKAGLYQSFIFKEVLPFIRDTYHLPSFREKIFAGFSLGGLSALDMVWHYPDEFKKAGVFSGSLWWRSIDQTEKTYDDHQHRIMHQVIRNGQYKPGLKFFFQCGNKDETKDRNQNGIIDSIDDTQDLIKELIAKGYDPAKDIHYLEMPEGRHDIPTWALAMPEFLKWIKQ